MDEEKNENIEESSEESQDSIEDFFSRQLESEGDTPDKEEVKGTPVDNSDDISRIERKQDVSDFLSDPSNADYVEFGSKIRELAARSESKGLTVGALAAMAVPRDYWLKKGAELATQAAQEGKHSASGGHSARGDNMQSSGNSNLPDPSTMDDATFEAEAWRIARGG